MNPAQSERHALCNLFLEVGPDAPTLCEGWTTRDLAAHIIVRESRPDAAGGILLKPLAAYGEKVRKGVAQREWKTLVEAIRNGPPRLSPMRLAFVDRLTNTVEFFVHLEDVRRAQSNWEPRTLIDDLESQLRTSITQGGRLFARKSPCGLVLQITQGSAIVAKKGEPAVTVTGEVGELIMFVYGRQNQARVELSGPDELVQAVRSTAFGV
jgi:uncharacterized protein (TIGR03085 family)